jgi:hypothetical protein
MAASSRSPNCRGFKLARLETPSICQETLNPFLQQELLTLNCLALPNNQGLPTDFAQLANLSSISDLIGLEFRYPELLTSFGCAIPPTSQILMLVPKTPMHEDCFLTAKKTKVGLSW